MKKLILIITLLVSIVMFSSPSYSEWTKLSKNMMGNIFYVDFERLRKNSGYVYWWDMVDYLKITDQGILSHKQYRQGDCKLFRYKVLDYIFYKEPMGGGKPISVKPHGEYKDWQYPPPNSSMEDVLKAVCSQ